MEKLVLVKLGGSLITDKNKDRTSRPETIERLAGELKKVRRNFDGKIIVAHGAGSFAHRPALEFKVKEGIKGSLQFKGFPIVADRAIELNRVVIRSFLDQKLPVVSFSPESCILANNFKVEEVFCDPIEQALR
jgi:isopentenyl phosphate kinase